MKSKYKKQMDTNNYSFLFKCMTALTTAAIVTAGVIAAASLKSAAIATSLTTASILPLLPITPAIFIVIALLCVLPFIFGNRANTTIRTTTPGFALGGYRNLFYAPYIPPAQRYHRHPGSIYTGTSHIHGHPYPTDYDSHHHGHDHSNVYDNHHHGHNTRASVHVHSHR